jgi:hypothetical protein
MSSTRPYIRGFAAFLMLAVFLSGCKAPRSSSKPDTWMGTAELDITPPVGHRMAGYFDERVSTAVHDPLLAKAVVLRQGGTRLALVFCDLVGLSLDVTQKARAEASRRTGIPMENIMICATHTHTGPLFDDVRRQFLHEQAVAKLGSDPHEAIHYPDFLAGKLVSAITEANAHLTPVTLHRGRGKLDGYSFNRRFHMTNGVVQTNPGIRNPGIVRPAGPVDHSVDVLQARSVGGAPASTITTFPCHCDTCGGTQFSGDYPFFLAESLRTALGNGHLSAFAAGTCGDINHIDVNDTNRITGFAKSRQIGTNLANAVLQTTMEPIAAPRFAVRSRTVPIPLQEVTPEQVTEAKALMLKAAGPEMPFTKKVEVVKAVDLGQRGREVMMEVQVFRLDKDTAIVCLPGEIFVELGMDIKRRSPFPFTTVMTICNDRPSYVPTLKAFREGSYEVLNARVKPGSGEILADTAVALLKQLR